MLLEPDEGGEKKEFGGLKITGRETITSEQLYVYVVSGKDWHEPGTWSK